MLNGCLILHGLTGTPTTVMTLRDALMAAGYRVSVPCLAGHGGSVKDLAESTWKEWYDTARTAFELLRRDVERVYCAGLSLGALLALKLAAEDIRAIRALALMATPLKLSFSERFAAAFVRYTPLRWAIRSIPKDLKKSVGDAEGRKLYQEFSLPIIPAHSVFELVDLQKEVLKTIARVSSPTLILHGRDDGVSPPFNIRMLKRKLSSDVIETRIFPMSRHVITMDVEKEEVAKSVVDFFRRFA